MDIMKVIMEEAQAKFVPAAAVIRIVQVFDLMTRCTRPQRRLIKFLVKNRKELPAKLKILFN